MMHDLKGHPRSNETNICQNHSRIFVYGPILMKICMNANIMKRQFFHKCHFHVMEKFCEFFTLRPSDLITIYLKIHSEGSKVL